MTRVSSLLGILDSQLLGGWDGDISWFSEEQDGEEAYGKVTYESQQGHVILQCEGWK